jgi:hypothetical protein
VRPALPGGAALAGTVVAWYAIDRADWQDAGQRTQVAPAG